MGEATPIRPGIERNEGGNVPAFLAAVIADHVKDNDALPEGAIILLFDNDGVPTCSFTKVNPFQLAFAGAYLTSLALKPPEMP